MDFFMLNTNIFLNRPNHNHDHPRWPKSGHYSLNFEKIFCFQGVGILSLGIHVPGIRINIISQKNEHIRIMFHHIIKTG